MDVDIDRNQLLQKAAQAGFPTFVITGHGEVPVTIGGQAIWPTALAIACECVVQQLDQKLTAMFQQPHQMPRLLINPNEGGSLSPYIRN